MRRISRQQRGPVTVACVVALGMLGACASEDDTPVAGTSPGCGSTPSPTVTLAGPTAVFDLRGVAVPTEVSEENGFLVVMAEAQGLIPDLAIDFMRVVEAAGFDVAGSDDEGSEAEVFFASGQVAAGQVVLTESDCPGVVDVRITLLDDPTVLPDEPSRTPPSTTPTS